MEVVENQTKKRLKQVEVIFHLMRKSFIEEDLDKFNIYLNNFIINARTITFLLQKEFNEIPKFSDWYISKKEELQKFNNFVEMRNIIEKEGNFRNTMVFHITVKDKNNPSAKLLTAEIDEKGKFKNEIYGSFELKPFFGNLGSLKLDKLDFDIFKECKKYLEYLKNIINEAYRKFK